jgi:hypothetical protein
MLEHMWPPIKRAMIYKLLLPYIIYLGCFTAYCLNLREVKAAMKDGDKIYEYIFYSFQGIIAFITAYLGYIELIQYSNTK